MNRLIVLVIVLFLAGMARGGEQKSIDWDKDVIVLDQGDRIVLEQIPCEAEAKALFRPGLKIKQATYVWLEQKVTIAGCWILYQGRVFLAFDDLDRYALPMDSWRKGSIAEKGLGGGA